MESKENDKRAGKKRKKLQAQFVLCQRLCRPMPEVKRVMKRLSSTRKFCKDYEWKRRPFIPRKSQKADDVGNQHEEKDSMIVNTGVHTNTQSKEEENLAKKNGVDYFTTHNKEAELVAEKSNTNSDTQSKEGEHVAEESGAYFDTQNKEKEPVAVEGKVLFHIQSREVEPVTEEIVYADAEMNEEENASDSNSKFSCSREIIGTVNKSESERRRRVMELLGQLDLDSSVILKPSLDPREQDVLVPYILESSDAGHSDKAAAAACKSHCSNTSQPQKKKKFKTNDNDALKNTQEELNTAEPSTVKRCRIRKKRVSNTIPEKMNITGQRKLKRSKASDKEVSGHVERKSDVAGPQRIKRCKIMGFDVTEHIEGKPIAAKSQKREEKLESNKNINEDISKNLQEKSSIAGPRKRRRIKAIDKNVPKLTQTPKPQLGCRKRGRKSKAEKARLLLLEQMVQCYNVLQISSSDSHRHIAHLLSQEIEKVKEGELTAHAEASHEQGSDVSTKPSETTEARVDDCQLQEDFESQVLEIEATFLMNASAGGGQEIPGMSLLSHTLQCSSENTEVSGRTEESTTNKGSREGLEKSSELLPPILTQQYAQFKPYLSLPSCICSDDSLSPDKHNTISKHESPVSQNIPFDNEHTQAKPAHLGLHYTSPVCIESVSRTSPQNTHTSLPGMMQNLPGSADSHTEPQHSHSSYCMQQETSPPSIPHSTDADQNVCSPDHTVTKLHVSTLQDSPPEGHSFVLNHIQADPKVGFQENQEQPQFSSPQHTQLESFSLIPHHTQTEPLHSQSEPCYPVCSSPKKKARKSSQKFMCNYNLRSKGLSNDVSETGRPTEVSDLTSLLKKHCKSEPRVCLRKVECDPSVVVIKNAESQRLSGPIARDMSLPISIPFSMLSLPSEQRNVMEVLEKVDCEEGKSIKGKLQESSSKSACMKDDSDEKWLFSNAQGSTVDESDVSVVSDGGAENSVKETSCKKNQRGIAEENFSNEMCHESFKKGPSVMQEGTDLENSQGETVDGSLLEEKFGEMSQNSDLNQETGVESLGGTFDGNILKETSGKSSHKTEDNEMTQEGTDAANSQGGIVDGNFCNKICIEDCQEVETIEVSQEGTDEASTNNQGESDNVGHQKVLQRVENNYEASQVEACQVLAVSVGDSWEGKSGEQGEIVVVAAVNSEGRTEIEMCQMMAVNDVNSQEATSAKGSQLVVVSGGDNQEGGGQVHGEGINSFMPSLYSDGNSNSDFDNTTLHPHQRSKSAHCNFDAKRSNLDQTSISNDDGVRDSGRATLGQDLCSGIIEQSGTLNVDEEKVNSSDNKQCPPGSDEPSLYQSECGAAGVLCDISCSQTGEGSITTQCVHYLPTETELLEDLERHLDYTKRDWNGQSSFESPEVTLKDTAVGETSSAQASSEEQSEPRQGCESSAPASAPHCEGHDMHTDHTNLNEEGKDVEAASNGDTANSDGEDVLSLYTDYSLLDADISGEAVANCESDDLKESHDTEEDHTEEHSSVSKNEGMAGDVKGSVLAELSEHSQSGDGLEVGTASDEALCLTDSDTESLQSKSSVIDRIVENEAKCTLEEEMLESDALNSLPSGVKDGQSNEAEGPVEVFRDEQEVTTSPLLSPHEVLLSDNCSRECSVSTSTPNNVISPHCSKPSQNQKNLISLQADKPGERGCRGQEEACDKTINNESLCASSKSNKKTQPPPAAPTQAIPPPPHRKRTTIVPKLLLPDNMGICFCFINRGFCERQDCHFIHEVTLECERYLGLRILFLVTNSRQKEAWTLLRHHLSHHRNSLPLAVSLLLPLAEHLVTLSHDKQPSCIRVPSFLTLPLDVAKVRFLCEERHGKAAFRLLCSCHTRASPEGLKILLNIFVRFCESFSERQMLSPWDKVVFWGYDCYGGDSEAKLKDLLNIEWLRLKMSCGNVSKVLEAYSHLSQALTSPNMFFTHITCQVISYFIDAGKLQDSFRVLGEVRRLRANSSSIFMALIPTKRESIQSLVAELQELGGLVCELCVPMPASSWSLLLSHMMAIHDLSLTLDLLLVQMNFMTPEIGILKCLLEEGIAKGPAMLQPLCSFVCQLPEEVLRPLEGSLSCLVSACTPSSQHIKSQIIQHCKKFGINLRPHFSDSALLIEEQTEYYQCNSSAFLKEKNSSINSDNNTSSNNNSTISDYLSSNRSINCNHRELQSHAPPSQFVAIHHEMNTSESSGFIEHVVGDRECFQDLRCDNVPTVCEQSELPMPPTPKSLPSSVKSESVNNHLVMKPSAQEECAIAQKMQQQSLMIDYNHQMPSKESPCNLRTQDKLFTVMKDRNSSHDLASSLMSPDSTNISPNISHTKIDNKEKSPANSRVIGKLAKPTSSCGFRLVQTLHTHSQKACSKSLCKDLDSFNEIVSKTHAQCRPLKNSSTPQKSEEIPRFRTVKRDNFNFPKITFNQDLSECETPNLEGLVMNHFPPCDDDSTTSSGVENNHDTAAPLKYPRVAENVMKMFSPTSIAVENLQVSSQQDQRSLSHQQPTTSRQIHQTERDSSSGRFSRWSGRPFTMPQRHWFPMEKDGQVDHMRSSPTLGSSPSSGFSDPYVRSSPPSRPSSRMSLRNEYDEPDDESSEQPDSCLLLVHQIATVENITEKRVRVAELAASFTDCSNIYSSGSKFNSIMRACRNGVLSPEVREVIGALGILVMLECIRQKIFSEAELTILSLQLHKLSFLNSLVSWKDGCSEQQLAMKALQVLYHMKNYSLFIDILEETSWSGGVDDVRTRLQLLNEVLDVLRQLGKNKVSLWYTGKILAFLLTYYHRDTMMLHNYHNFLDLPSHLEAAWEWVEALEVVGVVEQFTVILNTALRLRLPFSQHFIYHLMNRGIGVGSREMIMAPERNYGEPPLLLTVPPRECASLKWKGNQRQGRGKRGGSKRRGGFQGTCRGGRPHGHHMGQAALDRQQN